jgi:hypothetical protein
VDNFQFRKEDLAELFDLLRKPMETVLEFVARTTDLVKVKNRYTILYKTGLLMIIYWLLCPHRVQSEVWPLSGFHFWRLHHVYQCTIHHHTPISDKPRPIPPSISCLC